VTQWADKPGIEVTINPNEEKQLKELLFSGLREEAKDKVMIRTSVDINKGFRIGIKNEDVYYDFSEDTVADLLRQFLNPTLVNVLENKNG
jgi:vacuolar-type H+-ATPase subunit E/Vma4